MPFRIVIHDTMQLKQRLSSQYQAQSTLLISPKTAIIRSQNLLIPTRKRDRPFRHKTHTSSKSPFTHSTNHCWTVTAGHVSPCSVSEVAILMATSLTLLQHYDAAMRQRKSYSTKRRDISNTPIPASWIANLCRQPLLHGSNQPKLFGLLVYVHAPTFCPVRAMCCHGPLNLLCTSALYDS